MTVDEELNVLDDNLRRLKIEYDIFFGGGSKKPPVELEWRVQSLIKKHSDTSKLSFAQRFRYNAMAQKYAIFGDLWRQKMKVKEEGYRRPADAVLAIQGLRTEQSHAAEAALKKKKSGDDKPAKIHIQVCNPAAEQDTLRSFYQALGEARRQAKDTSAQTSFEQFCAFVHKKTEQIKKQYGCAAVQYELDLQNGRVKLVARPQR